MTNIFILIFASIGILVTCIGLIFVLMPMILKLIVFIATRKNYVSYKINVENSKIDRLNVIETKIYTKRQKSNTIKKENKKSTTKKEA